MFTVLAMWYDSIHIYIAGSFEGEKRDTAWCVSEQPTPQPAPIYQSNAEETDRVHNVKN